MSEINRPYTAYLMDSLSYSRTLRRTRQFSQSLLEIYELIPDLEPEIQEKLSTLETDIEDLWKKAQSSVEPGNEYSRSVEVNEAIQQSSAKLLREARKLLMKELMEAGYFEYEKTTGFHDPTKGRRPGTESANLKSTVKRDI